RGSSARTRRSRRRNCKQMRIVKLTTETDEKLRAQPEIPAAFDERSKLRSRLAEELQAGLNAPVDLGYTKKVAYNDKTDRYVLTFIGSEKEMSLKATDDVAAFVAEHLRKAGTWTGRIEKGTLTDVFLITVE